jgi:hypothetical protein
MLHNITWPQFWLTVISASVCYYLFIWVVYFKTKFSFSHMPDNSLLGKGDSNIGADDSDLQLIMQDLEPAFDNKQNKTELMMALKKKIQSYHEISEPGFRDAINGFIVSESLAKCSIRLEEVDLRTLWK